MDKETRVLFNNNHTHHDVYQNGKQNGQNAWPGKLFAVKSVIGQAYEWQDKAFSFVKNANRENRKGKPVIEEDHFKSPKQVVTSACPLGNMLFEGLFKAAAINGSSPVVINWRHT